MLVNVSLPSGVDVVEYLSSNVVGDHDAGEGMTIKFRHGLQVVSCHNNPQPTTLQHIEHALEE